MALTITQQDRQLLELVAIGESGGDYNVVNRVGRVPELTSMTLQQVLDYAWQVREGPSSGAVGKYQFVPPTLEEVINRSGIPRTTIFSSDIQDYLIIQRLYQFRNYQSWINGSLPDDQFMINLAKEFASVPVPYAMQGQTQRVEKGQSYYQGLQGNRAVGHTVEGFLQQLADIRSGGPGATITLSETAALSATGNLPMTQAEILAGGGQRLRGGSPYTLVSQNTQLPIARDPYLYVPIAAESNRYDFRTGKKVRDILVNGTNPVFVSGLDPTNGRAPVADVGRAPFTPEQEEEIESQQQEQTTEDDPQTTIPDNRNRTNPRQLPTAPTFMV